ncbi:hypothetical protein A3D62_02470 [Candidatus Kaiserbacteria bacterium RIFCSPHIGHO2_02_FULL_49_11]|uniref:Uncharacterized protein n=2 Tax=Parcubacteria group TaxID=1794811 RepID=A0A1G2QER4_9BACT|nr:MAG: hypothetical protein A3D62_02470 [Candidatus Kaiserbacteria bacterium RIFCSPHIGHO2_02_FULL_49_11]OHA58471.1 MAG: hypothetical protein A2571_01695 [Candidatus Vogelbacteria bacterium RIFOXYD1_FULL_44_32]HIG96007.1 hypothetical protein [Candidatus Woesearchaeota archaeon]
MTWYQKTLKKCGKEILTGAIFSIICTLAFFLWIYGMGKTFTWTDISPIDPPSIFVRIFYSALTFVTLGAFLYKIKFYQGLYRILGNWQSFKEAKAIIWVLLMGTMFFIIVPLVVDILNGILSITYNLFALALYAFPPVGISVILFVFYFYFKKQLVLKP